MDKDILQKYDESFYKIMAENFGDEIFVTDGDGIVLFVNPAACEVVGKAPDEIIGRDVRDLVKENIFKPSSTLEVLKQRKTIHMIQTVRGDKSVIVTGVPIFDDLHENIKMVISTTKDVDALNEILQTIEKQKEEITNLRNIAFEQVGYVVGNKNGDNVKTLMKIAPLDMPVLIQGETGVGKEVAANTIHMLSYGKKKPFIKINCGTIPENLIESELFGYEKGAFTGAEKEGKKGKVELADGGTLFLDEIGELPLALQVKLLDFLQDGTFTRVGGTKSLSIKTRLITATNRDLNKMCEEGKFRKDLFFRINAIPYYIPPLKERPDDLDALCRYFITECNKKYNTKKTLDESAAEKIRNYNWPGNVRELEHVIEHAYVMAEGDIISKDDLSLIMNAGAETNANSNIIYKEIVPLKDAKLYAEKHLVGRAYEKYGNTYKVAEALGIDQSTVVKLLKKHNI